MKEKIWLKGDIPIEEANKYMISEEWKDSLKGLDFDIPNPEFNELMVIRLGHTTAVVQKYSDQKYKDLIGTTDANGIFYTDSLHAFGTVTVITPDDIVIRFYYPTNREHYFGLKKCVMETLLEYKVMTQKDIDANTLHDHSLYIRGKKIASFGKKTYGVHSSEIAMLYFKYNEIEQLKIFGTVESMFANACTSTGLIGIQNIVPTVRMEEFVASLVGHCKKFIADELQLINDNIE